MRLFGLLSSAVLLLALKLGGTAAAIPNWNGNGTTINVCTSEYTPMVYCVDKQPEEYSGYEIELFRAVAAELGWKPEMLTWKCMDWDVMLNHLKNNDGFCDIAVAGVDVNEELTNAGIVYTWPTFRNGFKVLTTAEEPVDLGIWTFFDAFEWEVWVVTAVTILVVPFIVYAVDKIAYPTPPPGADPYEGKFSTHFWNALARPFWMSNMTAYSWAANIIILGYAFLIMILFALYIGYAASNLTTTLLDNQVTGVADLPGRSVGTWKPYTEQLQKYGIGAKGYNWENVEDEQKMIAALKSGKVDALVLEGTVLDYFAATDCDLVVVGSNFENYEQATAFPAGFSDNALLNKYNDILANLTASGTVEEIQSASLLPEDAVCGTEEEGSIVYSATFKQVAGLWILLAGAIGVAFILMLLHFLHVRYTKSHVEKTATKAAEKIKSKLSSAASAKATPTPSTGI